MLKLVHRAAGGEDSPVAQDEGVGMQHRFRGQQQQQRERDSEPGAMREAAPWRDGSSKDGTASVRRSFQVSGFHHGTSILTAGDRAATSVP